MRNSEETSPPPHYMDSYGNLVSSSSYKRSGMGSLATGGFGGLTGGYSSKEASIDALPTRKR